MSSPAFFQTGMGRTFFEHTLPQLVQAIQSTNATLKKLSVLAEQWVAQPPGTLHAPMPEPASCAPSSPEETMCVDTTYVGSAITGLHGRRVRICGVFRDAPAIIADRSIAGLAPVEVTSPGDVARGDWVSLAVFGPHGRFFPVLETAAVTDLERFAHLRRPNEGVVR